MTVFLTIFWIGIISIVLGVVFQRAAFKHWPRNPKLWNNLGCSEDCVRNKVSYWNFETDSYKGKPCPKLNAQGVHNPSGLLIWVYALFWPVAAAVLVPAVLLIVLAKVVGGGIGRGTKVITNSMQKAVTS